MFAELVEFGKRIRTGHDALKAEKCSWYIAIDENGNFKALIPSADRDEITENIVGSKKGKARLLLDKAEETLCFADDKAKHERYIAKLREYQDLEALKPVLHFYENENGHPKALEAFNAKDKKQQTGNMTFILRRDDGSSGFIVRDNAVTKAIIEKFNERQAAAAIGQTLRCSVCGSADYPILDEPHGSVKMPNGQTAGSMLVSYNAKAFESYGLKGNLNSGICTNCARNYIEALGYLLGNGPKTDDGTLKFTNRQDISDDTVLLFWTREKNDDIDPFSDICQPSEDRIKSLFASVVSGDTSNLKAEVDNLFYSCTLSSATARIAVRDWISISISQYKHNIKEWFEDIATIDKEGNVYYPGITQLIDGCIKRKSNNRQRDKKAKARLGAILWHSALTRSHLPSMLLSSVLAQIEHGKFTPQHSTLLRLIINRNVNTKHKMKETLDNDNMSIAYLCGRLFALICKQQYKALGNVNRSIKDRFFAAASISPARVMGLLLTKYVPIYEKKAKGAYSKSISELSNRIGQQFPKQFSFVERGEFALGYYYQNKENNK